MVKPSVKKKVIMVLRNNYTVGIKGISSIVGYNRSSFYCQSKLDDTAIIEKLNEVVEKKPHRGFDYYYKRSRSEGCTWSRGRMFRVYRMQDLARRPKKRKKLPEQQRKPLYQPEIVNRVCIMCPYNSS